MDAPTSPSTSSERSVPAAVTEPRPRKWEPANLFEEMQSDLTRFLELSPFGVWPFGRLPRRMTQVPMANAPRVDVFERGDTIVVKAELPGVKKEDIDLSIEEGDLVLRAEQREEREVKDEHWYRMERRYGSLYRRLPLPEGVKAEGIQASLRDGVLEVTMPKPNAPAPQAQKIAIGEGKGGQEGTAVH
jgi:HSP20 family protein